MIQVFNQHVEVKSLADNKNRGFLNSMLAIGNLRSIDLYNQENKSLKSTGKTDPEKEEGDKKPDPKNAAENLINSGQQNQLAGLN